MGLKRGEANACDGAAMHADDERALLRRVAAGDEHALRCLYARYRTRLWTYLFHQLDGDAGWTEEVVQDVFLAVWRSAATFRGDAQPATWLFRIAHNLAVNARRDRSRRPQAEPLEPADVADERADPLVDDAHDDAVLDRLALSVALGRLSLPHREALGLVFVQGFSLGEAATILDVPVGTVKSRISYARRALRTHLASQSSEGDDVQAAGMVGENHRDER